jgi:hypothetical protein
LRSREDSQKIISFIKENHDKLTSVNSILISMLKHKVNVPFKETGASFCDGIIIPKIPQYFDTEEKVKDHFSKHDLFVFKAKNANAKNSHDNSRWFIRFDDSHA